jgi:FG-GAP repeat
MDRPFDEMRQSERGLAMKTKLDSRVVVTVLFGALLIVGRPLPVSGQVRGDFNGDGRSDLAIGVPFEDFGAIDDGGVNVIYGSAAGLAAAGNQFWSQNSFGIAGGAETGDRFGSTLAAGDFNGDGFADLAIGVPFEDIGVTDAGGVNVIYGSAAGLAAAGNQFWSQDSFGIAGGAESGDRFGSELAAANFGNTSHGDLAIGVPFEDIGATDAGGVNVIYGSAAGLSAAGNQFWSQDSFGIAGGAETGDRFGSALAAADFGNTSHADLAIGVPFEDFGATDDGGVNVIYGSAAGLSAAGNQFWSQDSVAIAGGAESGDRFGSAVSPKR